MGTQGPPPTMPLRYTFADLLKADPTLIDRLTAEGRYHKVDAAWAQGSVQTAADSLVMPCTWRAEMHADAERQRAKVGAGSVDTKEERVTGRRLPGRRCA